MTKSKRSVVLAPYVICAALPGIASGQVAEELILRAKNAAAICGAESSLHEWSILPEPELPSEYYAIRPLKNIRVVGPSGIMVTFTPSGLLGTIQFGDRDNLRRSRRDSPKASAFANNSEVERKARLILNQLDATNRTFKLERVDGSERKGGEDPGDVRGKVGTTFSVHHDGYQVMSQMARVNFDRETGDVLWVAIMPALPIDSPNVQKSPDEAGAIITALVSDGTLGLRNHRSYLLDQLSRIDWKDSLRLRYFGDGKHYSPPRTRLCYEFASLDLLARIDAETGAVVDQGTSKRMGMEYPGLVADRPGAGGTQPAMAQPDPEQPRVERTTVRDATEVPKSTNPVLGATFASVLVLLGTTWWWTRRPRRTP